jgi:cysteine desulfurase family protein
MTVHEEFEKIHYLDNAATVYPKPGEVLEKMLEAYRKYGVNPGRSGYDLCLVGGDLVQTTRAQLTSFFGGKNSERLCFTSNASDALNLLIQGIVDQGDHVISTTVEHNSVIRPLNHLRKKGLIDVDFLRVDGKGILDPEEIAPHLRSNTKLVIVNHASNVIGTVQPVAEIGRICREHGLTFVVDTAQTAGAIPIDVEAMSIDALAFTGHKSLLGPTGIGGLYVKDSVDIEPTRFGGTGVKSAYPYQLEEYPFRLEVGTLNVLGIAGLHFAQTYLEERTLNSIYGHEMELFEKLQSELSEIPRVKLHGTTSLENRLPVLSLTIDGWDPSDVGTFLDMDHNVACRTGLQCAPLIHDEMGTSPRGTVRLSVGPMNVQEDIDAAVLAVRDVAEYTRH